MIQRTSTHCWDDIVTLEKTPKILFWNDDRCSLMCTRPMPCVMSIPGKVHIDDRV